MEPEADTTKHSLYCSECQRLFPSSSALEKHMKIHSHELKYQCKECNKKYATVSGLEMHMRMHNDDRRYKCDICCKAFMTRSVLLMHVRGHTGEKPYVCKECGMSYTQSASLAEHMNVKHNQVNRFKCIQCQVEMKDKCTFRQHLLTEHGDEAEKCEVCNKRFTTKRGLMNHEKLHIHETLLKCDTCGEQFNSKQKLTLHVMLHIPGEKPHEFEGRKRVNEQKPMRRKNKVIPRRLRVLCKECGILPRNIDTHMLTMHKRTHFGRFVCKKCGYRYYAQFALSAHQRTCPKPEHRNYFKCDYCEENCKDYKDLICHAAKHLEIYHVLPPLNVKGNLVNPCYYVKNFNESFEKHVPIGIRKYICNAKNKVVKTYDYPNGLIKTTEDGEFKANRYVGRNFSKLKDSVILFLKKEPGPSKNQVLEAEYHFSSKAKANELLNNVIPIEHTTNLPHGLQLEIKLIRISKGIISRRLKREEVYTLQNKNDNYTIMQGQDEMRNEIPEGMINEVKSFHTQKEVVEMSAMDTTVLESRICNSMPLKMIITRKKSQYIEQQIESNERVSEQTINTEKNSLNLQEEGTYTSKFFNFTKDEKSVQPSLKNRMILILENSENIDESEEISLKEEHLNDELSSSDQCTSTNYFSFPDMAETTPMNSDVFKM